MTTEDSIVHLFCLVDDRSGAQHKEPLARRYPSEVVTIGVLFALKGASFQAFERWLRRDWNALFGGLPERIRLLRLLRQCAGLRAFCCQPDCASICASPGCRVSRTCATTVLTDWRTRWAGTGIHLEPVREIDERTTRPPYQRGIRRNWKHECPNACRRLLPGCASSPSLSPRSVARLTSFLRGTAHLVPDFVPCGLYADTALAAVSPTSASLTDHRRSCSASSKVWGAERFCCLRMKYPPVTPSTSGDAAR